MRVKGRKSHRRLGSRAADATAKEIDRGGKRAIGVAMADVDGTPRICEIVEYHLIDIDLKGLREFQTDTPQSDLAKSNVRTPAMRSGSPRTSRWPSALMASLYRARQFFHRPARELEIFGATFVGHAVADKMNDVANLNISFFFERLHGEPRPKT